MLVVCQACSPCCTADTGWPSYWCTNYEYPPNIVSGLLVTSVDPIMKEIGTAQEVRNFVTYPTPSPSGCTCGGQDFDNWYIDQYPWSSISLPVSVLQYWSGAQTNARLVLGQSNNYLHDWKCNQQFQMKVGTRFKNNGDGNFCRWCSSVNPDYFSIKYWFNCANSNLNSVDIPDFSVQQTQSINSAIQIWGSNQQCACPADSPTFTVISFPTGMNLTQSISAFTLVWDSTQIWDQGLIVSNSSTTDQQLYIQASTSMSIKNGTYTLQIYQQISGQPQINQTRQVTVTVTNCQVNLAMTIPTKTHYIGLNSITSWSLGPLSFSQTILTCGYTYSYTYSGIPSFITPTLNANSSTLSIETTTTDWTLAYSNPISTMYVTVTGNEYEVPTVTASATLFLIDPCQTITITSTDIIDFSVNRTKTNIGTTLLWYTGNNSLCPLSAPNFTVTSSPPGTNATNLPVFEINQSSPNLILSATPSSKSITGNYTVLIEQCIIGFPIRTLCSNQSVNVQVGACPDILTISQSQPLNKTHIIGFTPITNFSIDFNSFIEDNSACNYSFNYTNSALPSYLYSYYGTDNFTIETNTTNQMLAVTNPSTDVTLTITANENPAITLSFIVTFIIIDPCISTNLINETIPDMYTTVLNPVITSFQMNLVNDTISLNISNYINGTNFCVNRTYSITSSPISNSTFTPNVLNNYLAIPSPLFGNISISQNGKITLSSSGWSIYGQHNVTVTVNFSPIIFTTFNFQVFIGDCVVLTLTPDTQDPITTTYTVADPPIIWTFYKNSSIQYPQCDYNLSYNFVDYYDFSKSLSNQPKRNVSLSCNISNPTICYASSLNRSDAYAGIQSFTQQVSVDYFNISESSKIQNQTFFLKLSDPCLNTVMICTSFNQNIVANITAWQGYSNYTINNYSVSDTVSNRVNKDNSTSSWNISDYCGKLEWQFTINNFTDKDLLNWSNNTAVKYSPQLNTTAGYDLATLTVILSSQPVTPNKNCSQKFNLTTVNYTAPKIPNQKYFVNSNIPLPINFTDFLYNPIEYQSHNYSVYIYIGKDVLKTPLDLNSKDFIQTYSDLLTFKEPNTIQVFSNNASRAYQNYTIVIVDNQDSKIAYTSFVLETFLQPIVINKPPYFVTNVERNIYLPGCRDIPWLYKLPELIDDENDVILPMNITIQSESITYDSVNRTFNLSKPVNRNCTDNIQIILSDDSGAKSKISLKVQFICTSDFFIQKKLELENQISKQKKWPGCEIREINRTGMVTIKFNSTMSVPQKDYELQNGTNLVNDTNYPNIVVNIIPGKYSELSKLKFNWTYVNGSYTTSSFQIQLDFKDPLLISTFDEPEFLEIIIYGYPYFLDTQGNFMRDGGFKLKRKVIPIQTTMELALKAIERGKIAFKIVSSVIMSSSAVNLLLSGPLQQILGVIKSTQIIVHMLLIKVDLPASAGLYFSRLMNILTFQILNMDKFYNRIFNFGQDDDFAFNDQFYLFGYQSIYFLKNLGAVILFILVPFLFWVLLEILSRKCVPKLKPYALRAQNSIFFDKTLTFFDESFMLLMLCATINLTWYKFDSFGTIINSVFTTFFFCICCTSPFFIYLLYQNDDVAGLVRKRQQTFMKRFGSLVTDLDVYFQGKIVFSYIWAQQFRKVFLVLTIIYLQKYELWSILSLNYLSLAYGCVIGHANPLKSLTSNRMELFNEFCILIVNYHLMCFTDLVPDVDTREIVGKSLEFTMYMNVGVNFAVIILQTLFHSLRKCKLYKLKLNQKKRIRRRTEIRQLRKEALAESRKIRQQIAKDFEQKKAELEKFIGSINKQPHNRQDVENQEQLNAYKVKIENRIKLDLIKPLNFNNEPLNFNQATKNFLPQLNLSTAAFETNQKIERSTPQSNLSSQGLIIHKSKNVQNLNLSDQNGKPFMKTVQNLLEDPEIQKIITQQENEDQGQQINVSQSRYQPGSVLRRVQKELSGQHDGSDPTQGLDQILERIDKRKKQLQKKNDS